MDLITLMRLSRLGNQVGLAVILAQWDRGENLAYQVRDDAPGLGIGYWVGADAYYAHYIFRR